MRRAAKRKIDPVAAEISALRGELVALGLHVIELRRELHDAITWRPVEDGLDERHYLSVSDAALLARVSTQTMRNWIDVHAIGRFWVNQYLVDRRLLREHLAKRGGKLPAEL